MRGCGKARCQLLLHDALAAWLARMADGRGRGRSDILAEARDVWMSERRAKAREDLRLARPGRLGRIDGALQALRRSQGLQWEVLARMLRRQLVTAAGRPIPDAALQAAASAQFEAVIAEIAARMAGGDPPTASDPAIVKVRGFD